ncbi:MarR family transcriptional regulator [Sulfurimonas sp. HSL-3221]|uniref:MarR family winged helix-turn-helix transcriptional regulator n=1 Tax=Sulfurimonadaceae TaxID=2771471 RepID=UPI001E3123DF|nr:MarR family transcriptional regulator [Sulfurimonas sp. HSL-3221]UFS61665.1 MarR family transcriptional regulator [Sulfurimonas sp. HSL-3221]
MSTASGKMGKPTMLGPLIARVKNKMRRRMNERLKPYGITAEQRAILLALCREGAMTQAQLCELTSMEPSNLSTTLKRLIAKGYVEKTEHPDEPRAYLVHATQKSRTIEQELIGLSSAVEGGLLHGIDDEALQSLYDTLSKMDANLSTRF